MTLPPCIKETRNYIVSIIKLIPKDRVITYRFKRIKNRKGVPHLLKFAQLDSGDWIMYEIYHPKKYETYDYVINKYAYKCML